MTKFIVSCCCIAATFWLIQPSTSKQHQQAHQLQQADEKQDTESPFLRRPQLEESPTPESRFQQNLHWPASCESWRSTDCTDTTFPPAQRDAVNDQGYNITNGEPPAATTSSSSQKKASNSSHNNRLGAIASLFMLGKEYKIINRDKSVKKYLLPVFEKAGITPPDMLLFIYQKVPRKVKRKIHDATPELRHKFRPVLFEKGFQTASGEYVQRFASCGGNWFTQNVESAYKDMCRFWSMGFLDYVWEYDWILRMDDDTEFTNYPHPDLTLHQIFPGARDIFVTSAIWMASHLSSRYDMVETGLVDGLVVTGLIEFTRKFVDKFSNYSVGSPAHSLDLPKLSSNVGTAPVLPNEPAINSFYSTYSNLQYFNVRLLRSGEKLFYVYNSCVRQITGGNKNRYWWNEPNADFQSPYYEIMDEACVAQTLLTLRNDAQYRRKKKKKNTPLLHWQQHEFQAFLILQFMREVDLSNCFYTNRWGDMPVWGAALAIVEQQVEYLPLSYLHGSHNVVVDERVSSGVFAPVMPYILSFSDHRPPHAHNPSAITGAAYVNNTSTNSSSSSYSGNNDNNLDGRSGQLHVVHPSVRINIRRGDPESVNRTGIDAFQKCLISHSNAAAMYDSLIKQCIEGSRIEYNRRSN